MIDVIVGTMMVAVGLLILACSLFITVLIGLELKEKITRS
jgi:hypothetical protein